MLLLSNRWATGQRPAVRTQLVADNRVVGRTGEVEKTKEMKREVRKCNEWSYKLFYL